MCFKISHISEPHVALSVLCVRYVCVFSVCKHSVMSSLYTYVCINSPCVSLFALYVNITVQKLNYTFLDTLGVHFHFNKSSQFSSALFYTRAVYKYLVKF